MLPRESEEVELEDPVDWAMKHDDRILKTGFNFKAFFVGFWLGLLLMASQILVTSGFYYLPLTTVNALPYLFNLLQLAFLVITILITYKVLSLHENDSEKSLLKKIVQWYKERLETNNPAEGAILDSTKLEEQGKEDIEKVGAIVGEALYVLTKDLVSYPLIRRSSPSGSKTPGEKETSPPAPPASSASQANGGAEDGIFVIEKATTVDT